jgi:hypothetical protein
VFACSFPELAEKADVSDWIAAGHSADDLRERADAAPVWLPTEFVSAPITPLAGRHLISHRASDIQPERLQWVWPGRIARGKVALLGGPPGLGKSQVTASIAAIVSSGGAWPCEEGRTPQGGVLILSAEDGIADTIVPRLIAAAANVEQVHIIAAATRPDGSGRRTFSLKTDVDLLERLAEEIGYLALADKASRTVALLAERLDQHRGRGQQQIVVKHVTVNADQALVTDSVVTDTSGGHAALPSPTNEPMAVLEGPQPVAVVGGTKSK